MNRFRQIGEFKPRISFKFQTVFFKVLLLNTLIFVNLFDSLTPALGMTKGSKPESCAKAISQSPKAHALSGNGAGILEILNKKRSELNLWEIGILVQWVIDKVQIPTPSVLAGGSGLAISNRNYLESHLPQMTGFLHGLSDYTENTLKMNLDSELEAVFARIAEIEHKRQNSLPEAQAQLDSAHAHEVNKIREYIQLITYRTALPENWLSELLKVINKVRQMSSLNSKKQATVRVEVEKLLSKLISDFETHYPIRKRSISSALTQSQNMFSAEFLQDYLSLEAEVAAILHRYSNTERGLFRGIPYLEAIQPNRDFTHKNLYLITHVFRTDHEYTTWSKNTENAVRTHYEKLRVVLAQLKERIQSREESLMKLAELQTQLENQVSQESQESPDPSPLAPPAPPDVQEPTPVKKGGTLHATRRGIPTTSQQFSKGGGPTIQVDYAIGPEAAHFDPNTSQLIDLTKIRRWKILNYFQLWIRQLGEIGEDRQVYQFYKRLFVSTKNPQDQLHIYRFSFEYAGLFNELQITEGRWQTHIDILRTEMPMFLAWQLKKPKDMPKPNEVDILVPNSKWRIKSHENPKKSLLVELHEDASDNQQDLQSRSFSFHIAVESRF